MWQYLARRALLAIPVILGVSMMTFFLIRLTPGDPVRGVLGPTATPDAIAFWRTYYRLDDPLFTQFVDYVVRILTLNFGESIQFRQPVNDMIAGRIGTSIVLVLYTIVIALSVALPLAVWSAVKANKWPDTIIRFVMMLSFAMPAFWLGITFVQIFSLKLKLFPASGIREGGVVMLLWSLTLPAIVSGLYLAPVLIRTLRLSMIESLKAEYVEAARARGLGEGRVLRRYVLRTSLISTATVLGVSVGYLIGGTVVVENVFALPGIGTLVVEAVGNRDFPMVQALTLLIGFAVAVISLFTDLVNAVLDPRIRR